jgi:hypothetical protein
MRRSGSKKKAPEKSGAFLFSPLSIAGPDPAIQSKLTALCL